MNSSDPRPFPAAPPLPAPKRLNTVLRLYDGPLYRDWAFWMTFGWGALAAASIPASTEPSQLPVWLDTLLAVVIMVTVFGLLPTWVRLLVRRWLWRRRQTRPAASALAGAGAFAVRSVPVTGAGEATPAGPPAPAPSPAPSAAATPAPMPSPAPATYSPSPAPPAPGGSFGGGHESVHSCDVLTRARGTLPHPVARAVRTLQLAPTAKEQYDALLDAAETLAITISVTAAALLRAAYEDDAADEDRRRYAGARLAELRKGFVERGAMFGTWTTWLGRLGPLPANSPGPLPGFLPALAGSPGSPGIVDDLNSLRGERNRAAHGDKPKSEPESALRVRECRIAFDRALGRARFLVATPWLLTVSCTYQHRSHDFHVIARDATGDHPDFERRIFTWERPVENDMFYVHGPAGPVPLSPFVANSFCEQCRQTEVCYTYRTAKNEGPATLKSFGRGHEIKVPVLGADIRSLPVRPAAG
ncbi:hypothetical protein SSPS47_20210 [Streptomyces sp. S4.7]|uniref:hypothetical protein n=1 Tax=Streptomyces sp. S4.7 TaxID=2705439 RepID=UPI0013975042|nr:hypothetical protein [Streptomyces sp. S4.7]QHY97434.1 hypothetical protein SSPS47_20210 [Streptomyces sp. S4.7]